MTEGPEFSGPSFFFTDEEVFKKKAYAVTDSSA